MEDQREEEIQTSQGPMKVGDLLKHQHQHRFVAEDLNRTMEKVKPELDKIDLDLMLVEPVSGESAMHGIGRLEDRLDKLEALVTRIATHLGIE